MIEGKIHESEQVHRDHLARRQQCLDEFEALEKPTIATLPGFCIGGRLILALCCDFGIASQRTVLSLPEVELGVPIIMGTQRVTRVAGIAAAKEMILLGKRFTAKAALAYGLLHRVVPRDKLDATVAGLAAKLQRLPPRTVGIANRIINLGCDLSLRDSHDLDIDALAELNDSPDVREALESYLKKRRPRFIGE